MKKRRLRRQDIKPKYEKGLDFMDQIEELTQDLRAAKAARDQYKKALNAEKITTNMYKALYAKNEADIKHYRAAVVTLATFLIILLIIYLGGL